MTNSGGFNRAGFNRLRFNAGVILGPVVARRRPDPARSTAVRRGVAGATARQLGPVGTIAVRRGPDPTMATAMR